MIKLINILQEIQIKQPISPEYIEKYMDKFPSHLTQAINKYHKTSLYKDWNTKRYLNRREFLRSTPLNKLYQYYIELQSIY